VNALYLDDVFALYHPAAGTGGPAVLLCPPLGWDDVCSYRARRDWAERLAATGKPALRFDYPGTGDSGGSPSDAGRVAAWTRAAAGAASWLRTESGRRRLVAIGIGLGGLIAWRAAAEGAPIDDLVLWGTPATGRALVRELRAFSRLESASLGEQVHAERDGTLLAGGFLLSAETVAALEAIELPALALPRAEERRVLLLGRDGMPPAGGLEQSAGDVAVDRGEGYGELMLEPQFSRTPDATIARVDAWLDAAPADGVLHTAAAAAPAAAEQLDLGDARERPFEAGGLFGIVTEPAHPAGVVALLLNAGSIRRIGANRMWVEAARRWSARGVTTIRVDVPGIGDAAGDSHRFDDTRAYYVEPVAAELRPVFEMFAGPFLVGGLCSGGYWSLQAALDTDRVAVAALVNTLVLVWDDLLPVDRRLQPLRATFVRALRERRIGELMLVMRVVRRRLADRFARAHGGDAVDRALDRLRDKGTQLVLVYEQLDPQRWELERDGRLARLDRWPNVTVEPIEGADHTLRPPRMQAEAHAALDRAVERLLAAQPPP
jgi:alpha/beta superfamily hydrolase